MHPLTPLFQWFPECDFGVLDHGYVDHGRDYSFLVETSMGGDPGRHLLQFTHVTELDCITSVADDVWASSWSEEFVDYQAWLQAGSPDGYVWGTCWSMAWPGMSAIEPSERADAWSNRLGKPMYEMVIHTDRFRISLVFHSLRTRKVNDETSTVSSVIVPLLPAER
jgi:hypothetical protein